MGFSREEGGDKAATQRRDYCNKAVHNRRLKPGKLSSWNFVPVEGLLQMEQLASSRVYLPRRMEWDFSARGG
jgi:hypothetical protein